MPSVASHVRNTRRGLRTLRGYYVSLGLAWFRSFQSYSTGCCSTRDPVQTRASRRDESAFLDAAREDGEALRLPPTSQEDLRTPNQPTHTHLSHNQKELSFTSTTTLPVHDHLRNHSLIRAGDSNDTWDKEIEYSPTPDD